jgi:predicted RNase H-like nuclease (RuvC/YqgF family)
MTSREADLQQQVEQYEQALQHAFAECNRIREDAARWQQRYEVEAQQRRKDLTQAQETIASLRQQLQELEQSIPESLEKPSPEVLATGATEMPEDWQSLDLPEGVKARLAERDRLLEALSEEKTAHNHTRSTLITMVADALGRNKYLNESAPLARR